MFCSCALSPIALKRTKPGAHSPSSTTSHKELKYSSLHMMSNSSALFPIVACAECATDIPPYLPLGLSQLLMGPPKLAPLSFEKDSKNSFPEPYVRTHDKNYQAISFVRQQLIFLHNLPVQPVFPG
ncbi:hypothetical protein P5673_022218 [Acropora cervicornis]|uniref:Uncharacterized protein n=1 Tax=Acropora cervicornis TaxID=6130 RepID=A0AAD9Q7V5_ACRCE|nr:hypothetical protein P5673_022218 [Acropora cervicornis]